MKRFNCMLSALLIACATPVFVNAEEGMEMHDHHHHHAVTTDVKRSEIKVDLPNVKLLNQSGKEINFQDEVNDKRIVVLSFIYTSCTAICPMTSQTLFRLQGKLADKLDKVHLMSISIDPEHDTPAILAQYSDKFHASKYWNHYTGTTEASIAVQKAVNAYRGDKMNHVPATFIWNGKGADWIRIDGFASADELLLEVQKQLLTQ